MSKFETPVLDQKDNQYLSPDEKAEENANYAAAAGKWEAWAQPGFERSAQGIALEAQQKIAQGTPDLAEPAQPGHQSGNQAE